MKFGYGFAMKAAPSRILPVATTDSFAVEAARSVSVLAGLGKALLGDLV